jgi:hypothetical protein
MGPLATANAASNYVTLGVGDEIKQVLKTIGEPHLQLIDDGGCWCFIYDDKTTGVFDTYRIYTMRLTDLPLCDWVGEGRGFVANVKKRSMPGTLQ